MTQERRKRRRGMRTKKQRCTRSQRSRRCKESICGRGCRNRGMQCTMEKWNLCTLQDGGPANCCTAFIFLDSFVFFMDQICTLFCTLSIDIISCGLTRLRGWSVCSSIHQYFHLYPELLCPKISFLHHVSFSSHKPQRSYFLQ